MHLLQSLCSRLLITLILTFSSADCCAANYVWPLPDWPKATPEEMGMDESLLRQARDYALTGGGSGYITRKGRLVMAWGSSKQRHDLKSTTKSIGVTALGLAIKDGKLKLSDKAKALHPQFGVPPASNGESGWLDEITIQHLATQTAGFAKPGGYEPLLFKPGTKWSYSDGGPNWLAECMTLIYGQDLNTLMFQRVFTPLGIKQSDLTWRKNAYRPDQINGIKRREFGSGISANVDAMARIGYLYLRGGNWNGREILPQSFVDAARAPIADVVGLPEHDPEKHGNASDHYGLLWWNNGDGTLADVPTDAYWSWGLYDSLIVVIPGLDIVVARAGSSWKRTSNDHYAVLKPFLEPIVASVKNNKSNPTKTTAPYPRSPVIIGVEWAPVSTIVRKAHGSDNWPITWADDDSLYTAYGDGWGFEPRAQKKLSLGLAKIIGGPDSFRGVNVRSPGAEQLGDGAKGKKASGMLMVDGGLWMLVRNAGNSQLAWSGDHGKTWQWPDWKFTTSFGYPTFLNFAANYTNARDDYVYVYSHDSDSAYEPADRMVMARVPKDRIPDRPAYEFLETIDAKGQPRWTKDIRRRGAVFRHPGRCYRSGISYNAPLDRYLWCQIHPQSTDPRGPRFQGGFGVYDAPEPWGPWTTVYFTDNWDVGPGETASFPTKWISSDGRTLCLVFSGEDAFSVRKVTFNIAGS